MEKEKVDPEHCTSGNLQRVRLRSDERRSWNQRLAISIPQALTFKKSYRTTRVEIRTLQRVTPWSGPRDYGGSLSQCTCTAEKWHRGRNELSPSVVRVFGDCKIGVRGCLDC